MLCIFFRMLLGGLADDVEAGIVGATRDAKEDSRLNPRKVSSYLRKRHGWDALAVRSIWAFGPDERGPNVLLDDTLPGEGGGKELLETVRGSVVQGFRWGCREGPLCDEPMRSCKFKVVDATLAADAIYRGAGQIIPAARRAMYSAFLVAEPRLLEPVFGVEILAPEDCLEACKKVLQRRRGHPVKEAPKPGTPYHLLHGYIPAMDSFGFETDLRCMTQGQSYVMQAFDHWALVPGDPLDKSVVLRPLEPAPTTSIARDFMIKTRRRKGLGDEVNAAKYFDDPTLVEKLRRLEIVKKGGEVELVGYADMF
jgi:116 kDa U5 small nuclear ribonucleoprotein component